MKTNPYRTELNRWRDTDVRGKNKTHAGEKDENTNETMLKKISLIIVQYYSGDRTQKLIIIEPIFLSSSNRVLALVAAVCICNVGAGWCVCMRVCVCVYAVMVVQWLCGVACLSVPPSPSRDEERCVIFGVGEEGVKGRDLLIPWWKGTIIMLLLEMTFGGVAVIPVLLM